jgi:probable HAF family extracellular repeat protein
MLRSLIASFSGMLVLLLSVNVVLASPVRPVSVTGDAPADASTATVSGTDDLNKPAGQHDPAFVTWEVQGSVLTVPTGINASGVIVGYFESADGSSHGFVRARDGSISDIEAPGAQSTSLNSINEAGEIAGGYVDSDHAVHRILW